MSKLKSFVIFMVVFLGICSVAYADQAADFKAQLQIEGIMGYKHYSKRSKTKVEFGGPCGGEFYSTAEVAFRSGNFVHITCEFKKVKNEILHERIIYQIEWHQIDRIERFYKKNGAFGFTIFMKSKGAWKQSDPGPCMVSQGNYGGIQKFGVPEVDIYLPNDYADRIVAAFKHLARID